MKNNSNIYQQLKAVVFDFDGVFTDNKVFISEDGKEFVSCSRSDGIGLQRLRQLGLDLLILSTETNPVVSARASKLKVDCVQGLADKAAALKDYASKNEIHPAELAFLGNDINDIECLKYVGLPVAVADAYPEVKKQCKLILTLPGGYGAVREFCDLVWKEYNR